tara:strand:- start:15 stop:1076 length:1062 start_codon:yes stop_codon:yes gene_type:complete
MAYTTVNKSSLHFNTKLWTGTGSENAITGIGFQPDWVWIKQRNTTRNHNAFDAVRGATKRIYPDGTNAEETAAQVLKSFDSDGFTLGTDTSANQSSGTYVSWNWKGNGQGSSNTSGSINSTYTSANTTSGFSIIKYTGDGNSGATIGHGLGVVPEVVLIKRLDGVDGWFMTAASLGWNKYIILNDDGAESGSSNNSFTGTAPTTTVFSVGSDAGVNGSGGTYVAYVFANVTGFSKVGGIYNGQNDTNGPLIYCGFKPAWLMYKETTSGTSQNWTIVDNKREPTNVMGKLLHPDLDNAESDNTGSTAINIDFLSTGFKVRGSDANINGGSKTYIYFAFAEAPLVGSNNVPATAR